MAQNIKIEKIDEYGNTIETTEINFADIVNKLGTIPNPESKYPWILTIDPYGDTILNHVQTPIVIRELEILRGKIEDETTKELIEKLISFLDLSEPHQYIKFIGD